MLFYHFCFTKMIYHIEKHMENNNNNNTYIEQLI